MPNENKDLPTTDPELRDDSEGARTLPVLPVRDTVLFPHAVLPLTVGRESSVQLINSLGEDKTIVVVAQREARVDAPQPTDLFAVGSLAVVHKVVRMPNQSLFVFAEGLERVKVTEYTQLTPFMRATVESIPEVPVAEELRDRSPAAQCADAVPADRCRLAHAVGRTVDRRRRTSTTPAAWSTSSRPRCRRFRPATSRTCWRRPTCRCASRRSTSTWRRSWKSSNCATRSRAKCRTAYSRRSASTTCASR